MEYFKLKELRKLARLSQQEVASFLGITSQAYGHYERGDRTPDPQTLKKLAEYFGVTVDYMLGDIREIDDEDKIKAIGGFALPPMRTIKVYGEVVCGKPVCEWETDEGTVSIDYKYPEEYFALKVRGDSMINAGIRPKSIVIVHKQSWAESGDIVVACLDGESTLKRYKAKDGVIVLMPENPAYEPIIVPKKSNLYIFGKVVECKVRF